MRKTMTVLIALIAFSVLVFVYAKQLIEEPPIMINNRLGDVVTAIHVMGTEKYDGHKPEDWEKRIGSSPKSADSWLGIFREHPEFFYTYIHEGNEKASLLWRRARNWSWDTKSQKEIDLIELEKWPEEKKG